MKKYIIYIEESNPSFSVAKIVRISDETKRSSSQVTSQCNTSDSVLDVDNVLNSSERQKPPIMVSQCSCCIPGSYSLMNIDTHRAPKKNKNMRLYKCYNVQFCKRCQYLDLHRGGKKSSSHKSLVCRNVRPGSRNDKQNSRNDKQVSSNDRLVLLNTRRGSNNQSHIMSHNIELPVVDDTKGPDNYSDTKIEYFCKPKVRNSFSSQDSIRSTSSDTDNTCDISCTSSSIFGINVSDSSQEEDGRMYLVPKKLFDEFQKKLKKRSSGKKKREYKLIKM